MLCFETIFDNIERKISTLSQHPYSSQYLFKLPLDTYKFFAETNAIREALNIGEDLASDRFRVSHYNHKKFTSNLCFYHWNLKPMVETSKNIKMLFSYGFLPIATEGLLFNAERSTFCLYFKLNEILRFNIKPVLLLDIYIDCLILYVHF